MLFNKEINSSLDDAGADLAEHDDYVLLIDKEWLAEQPDSNLAQTC